MLANPPEQASSTSTMGLILRDPSLMEIFLEKMASISILMDLIKEESFEMEN